MNYNSIDTSVFMAICTVVNMEMNNSQIISLRAILFASFLFLSVVSDGTHGDQNTQFKPLQCNNTAICAFSQPSTFLYSVLSVTSCATECYFKQYQSAPCVGFNYRATNNSCDIFTKEPIFSDQEEGCQYYQITRNTILNCATLPGLHLLGTLVTSLYGTARVLATAQLNGELFVTRLNVAQVSVYNTKSFSLLRQISFSGLGSLLYGLTSTSATNNYLYVADSTYNKVHIIDLSVTNSVSVLTWNVTGQLNRPYGLSLTSTGNVLVSFYYNKCVQEYTPDGSLVRTVTSNYNPWQTMELSNGLWVVLSPSSLCTVLTNGTLIKCFIPVAGSSLRFFTNDSNGYYLVTDITNNILLMVDPSLTAAHQLQLPSSLALQYPISLSLDQSRGRLYVGDYLGQYRVLVIEAIW